MGRHLYTPCKAAVYHPSHHFHVCLHKSVNNYSPGACSSNSPLHAFPTTSRHESVRHHVIKSHVMIKTITKSSSYLSIYWHYVSPSRKKLSTECGFKMERWLDSSDTTCRVQARTLPPPYTPPSKLWWKTFAPLLLSPFLSPSYHEKPPLSVSLRERTPATKSQ